MEQYGIISETRGDVADVTLQRHLICGSCGKCGIMSGSAKRKVTIEAHNPIRAEKGQRVVVESDDRQVIFLAFMLYIVPLLGLMAGIFFWLQAAGSLGYDGNQDLQAVAVGFILMAAIYLMIRRWDHRVKDNPQYKPNITGFLLDKPECEDDMPGEQIDQEENR